jgi:diguanylate cyclase (GGDEF)-like protein
VNPFAILPSSILQSEAFRIFAIFVGVNTIVYVGLTISKLFPWPKPVHPDRTRDLLGRRLEDEPPVEPIVPEVSKQSVQESGIFDIARAFGWLGGIVLVVGVLGVFLARGRAYDYVVMAAGLLFLAAGQVLARRRVSTRTASWLWSMSIAGLALADTVTAAYGYTAQVGFTLVLAVLLGAVALTWPSFLVAAGVLLALFTRIGLAQGNALDPIWIAPLFAALIAGAMVMVLRRKTLTVLGQVGRLSDQLGSTDLLTGVLTQQGVVTLGPTLRAAARRCDQRLFVLLAAIDGFDQSRVDYGDVYGDELLRGTAEVLRDATADGDLIGRWGADGFVVMGMGAEDRAREVAAGLNAAAADAPVTLGKPPLRLRVAWVCGTTDDTVSSLVARVEAQDPVLAGEVG